MNAVYNNPYRATKTEEYIIGKSINDSSAEGAANAAITDALGVTLSKLFLFGGQKPGTRNS